MLNELLDRAAVTLNVGSNMNLLVAIEFMFYVFTQKEIYQDLSFLSGSRS